VAREADAASGQAARFGSVMQDSFDVTTIVFLALAVFVIWRLRSVLGQKTGHERPPFDPSLRRREDAPPPRAEVGSGDNVVRLPGGGPAAPAPAPVSPRSLKGLAEPGSPAARGLEAIAREEPGFDPRAFADGAKVAYETIVTAFAKGDRKTLKTLLSREVGEGFERAIGERERRRETVETTFVSIDRSEIAAVEVKNRVAQVTVRFLSKLITATRDAQGTVIDGNPETVVDVTDVWTFARTLGSRDPNWQLVATEAGH
jgi:predicted lipid-binding transport protein (Tim44 family)